MNIPSSGSVIIILPWESFLSFFLQQTGQSHILFLLKLNKMWSITYFLMIYILFYFNMNFLYGEETVVHMVLDQDRFLCWGPQMPKKTFVKIFIASTRFLGCDHSRKKGPIVMTFGSNI